MLFHQIDTKRSFALFEKDGLVNCFQGDVHLLKKLEDVHALARKTRRDVAFVLPFHVIRERGFEAKGEEPILAMTVDVSLRLPKEQVIYELPAIDPHVEGDVEASVPDEDFANIVKKVQDNEIEGGNASQVVISRSFLGKLQGFGVETALGIYRKALHQTGQYMTVLFANIATDNAENSQYIVGCTPERHLEIIGNETIMVPIAGTLRKESKSDFEKSLSEFLEDPKEINELFQVTDEEMKMMGIICPDGGEIEGPFLREIGAVVHTEYQLVGSRSKNTIDALRHTFHAPTVVGSPMESAARIVNKYEPLSRRYYSGEIGVYKCPRTDAPNGDLDCAILIRCAEIQGNGNFRIQAGGGIVRDSTPLNEAHETRAKAMGILGVFTNAHQLSEKYLTPEVLQKYAPTLTGRNRFLSSFWMKRYSTNKDSKNNELASINITIINNEDDFAFMIGHMIRNMGSNVKVVDTFAFDCSADASDIVVIGPGPGDPTDMNHSRMKKIQEIIEGLKQRKRPLLGICLGHQSLAVNEGISVERQTNSSQGVQRKVHVWGEERLVGFYNSFSPVYSHDAKKLTHLKFDLDENNRIIALLGDRCAGFQFHPESIMSEDGGALLRQALMTLSISAHAHPFSSKQLRRALHGSE